MSDDAFLTNPILPRPPLAAMLTPGVRALQAARAEKPGERAAKDFESVLLYKVMEEMKRTIPASGLLESGISEQVRDLFWYYLAQDLAGKGGLGLWMELYRQMNPPGALQAAADGGLESSGPSSAGLEQSP